LAEKTLKERGLQSSVLIDSFSGRKRGLQEEEVPGQEKGELSILKGVNGLQTSTMKGYQNFRSSKLCSMETEKAKAEKEVVRLQRGSREIIEQEVR